MASTAADPSAPESIAGDPASCRESCSGNPSTSKAAEATAARPVVVRVKRKFSQSRLDGFWLEINGRPAKRAEFDFSRLSLSESAKQNDTKEACQRKLFVQHIETVQNPEDVDGLLQYFLPEPSGSRNMSSKTKLRSTRFKNNNKREELRSAARQNHVEQVKIARFEQIWKRRKGNKDADEEALREICHLYDAVQVDSEEERPRKEKTKMSLEDGAILCNYLPLLREFIPEAAEEIEVDLFPEAHTEDGFVYDLYTAEYGDNSDLVDMTSSYPLFRVDEDDDYYDGPEYSDCETDDSNAEGNPLCDYPDEETSGGDDNDDVDPFDDLNGSDSQYEEEEVDSEKDEEFQFLPGAGHPVGQMG